jgi:hypothetical protein
MSWRQALIWGQSQIFITAKELLAVEIERPF